MYVLYVCARVCDVFVLAVNFCVCLCDLLKQTYSKNYGLWTVNHGLRTMDFVSVCYLGLKNSR